MATPDHAHPELAKYIEKLIARHGISSWKRLFYIIREETVKTVEELVANDKLIYAGAQIELPPPEAKGKTKNKPAGPEKQNKYDRYTAIQKANKRAFEELHGKENKGG